MKHLLFLLFFCSSTLFAAKTYSVNIVVKSLATQEPIAGVTLISLNKKGKVFEATADENGVAIINGISDKKIQFLAIPDDGIHRELEFDIWRDKKRKDLNKTVGLFYNSRLEDPLVEAKTKVDTTDNDKIEKCPVSIIAAQFPGGYEEMAQYIQDYMVFPKSAVINGEKGKVYIKFSVDSEGEIGNVKVIRGVSPDLDHEAKLIICYMPKWTPATCDNQAVKSFYQIPINFEYD